MVTTNTNCQECVHLKACSIKDNVCEIKNNIMKNFEDVSSSIDIRCKEYMSSRYEKVIFR